MATFVLVGIALIFVAAGILMWLWNITMPQIFALKEIAYWQAFRLLLIAGLLLGGLHYQAPLQGGGLFLH